MDLQDSARADPKGQVAPPRGGQPGGYPRIPRRATVAGRALSGGPHGIALPTPSSPAATATGPDRARGARYGGSLTRSRGSVPAASVALVLARGHGRDRRGVCVVALVAREGCPYRLCHPDVVVMKAAQDAVPARCVRPTEQAGSRGRPSQARDVCEPRYSRRHKPSGSGADALRRTPRHGRGTHAGSSR